MYIVYSAIMEYIYGTILLKKIPLMYHYACYKNLSKNDIKKNNIIIEFSKT